jgi:hypothetical protein
MNQTYQHIAYTFKYCLDSYVFIIIIIIIIINIINGCAALFWALDAFRFLDLIHSR